MPLALWSEIFSMSARRRGTQDVERCGLLESVPGVIKRPPTECHERRHNIVVTKSFSREEIARCPEVQAAIRKEAEGLLKLKTWDEDSHIDKDDLIKHAVKKCIQIIIGDLLILGSIKFSKIQNSFGNLRAEFAIVVTLRKTNQAHGLYYVPGGGASRSGESTPEVGQGTSRFGERSFEGPSKDHMRVQ